jgi:hypothetical protein
VSSPLFDLAVPAPVRLSAEIGSGRQPSPLHRRCADCRRWFLPVTPGQIYGSSCLTKHGLGWTISPNRVASTAGADGPTLLDQIGPTRIMSSRARGYRAPARTLRVTRPSRLGNPFTVAAHGQAGAVAKHAEWLAGSGPDEVRCGRQIYSRTRALILIPSLPHLQYLACCCPLDQPCHADTLIGLVRATWAPTQK